jgi:hypothetical protein
MNSKKKQLTRLSSILKGLVDYKNDKAEYERIQKKYSKVNGDFINYGPAYS